MYSSPCVWPTVESVGPFTGERETVEEVPSKEVLNSDLPRA